MERGNNHVTDILSSPISPPKSSELPNSENEATEKIT